MSTSIISSRKSRNQKYIKNKFLIFIKISVLHLFSFKTPILDEKIKLYTHILLVY